jgi:hypothetical protein
MPEYLAHLDLRFMPFVDLHATKFIIPPGRPGFRPPRGRSSPRASATWMRPYGEQALVRHRRRQCDAAVRAMETVLARLKDAAREVDCASPPCPGQSWERH